MSFVFAVPEFLTTAAQDAAAIGTSLSTANAAAASSTTGVLAAGADEVSQAITALFNGYAAQYQSLSAQAAQLHQSFVQTLNAASGAYAGAEAANVTPLQTLEQSLLGAINAPAQTLFGRPFIGNGADGTAASPNGGAGGGFCSNGGDGLFPGARRRAGGAGGPAGPVAAGGSRGGGGGVGGGPVGERGGSGGGVRGVGGRRIEKERG
nr:PE family protein [Mycobacterium kansasii]